MAIVLYGHTGKLLYSNAEARELFFEGRSLTGENFLRLLDRAPEALRQGLLDRDRRPVHGRARRGIRHLSSGQALLSISSTSRTRC